jgi:hypothetical protein
MLKFFSYLVILVGLAGAIYYVSDQPKNSGVQASFGASALGLYKSDGITFLGKLLSVPSGSVCENFVYFDATGATKKLSYGDCNSQKVSSLFSSSTISNIYFTTTNCTGLTYISTSTFNNLPTYSDNYKYAFSQIPGGFNVYRAPSTAIPTGILNLRSYRDYFGACTSTMRNIGTITVNQISTSTPISNLCNGTCKVIELP